MTNLETKHYIATEKDITELTVAMVDATQTLSGGRNVYLRALVATTQKELGGLPRVRSAGRTPKLDAEAVTAQLAALNAVHDRFYAVVTATVQSRLPAGSKRGTELNRQTNFARTAVLTARNWVRTGHDLTTVGVAKLTKTAITVKRTPRPPSVAVLKGRVERQGKALVAAALELIDSDREAAMAELELVMSQLATQLLSLGGKTTRNADEAASSHRPLRVKSTVFVPTETHIIRQMRAPS